MLPFDLHQLKEIHNLMDLTKGYNIRIWKEIKGKSIYRIQTESITVHRKLLQMQEFELVAEGVNTELWVHSGEFSSIEKAHQTIKSIISNK